MNNINIKWVEFYQELADKLVKYKDNRTELIEKIKRVYEKLNWGLPKLETDGKVFDIDPFTVFGLFNKSLKDENRTKIRSRIKEEFGIKAEVPHKFDGIPVLTSIKATFYHFDNERGENDIDNLWEFFISAIEYEKDPSPNIKSRFVEYYDRVIKQKGVQWNITMGLFWIRPYSYINLDLKNRWFISEKNGEFSIISEKMNYFKKAPNGSAYLDVCNIISNMILEHKVEYENFIELSYDAWLISEEEKKKNKKLETGNSDTEVCEEISEYEDDYVYDRGSFLNEVYINPEDYDTIVGLIKRKKNIILQGAPGVGKTFAAKRIAYSMMQEKDESRIKMVQFHQSYSYEDFIMGYRPNESGFELKRGPFYNFCKKAREDIKNDYFFIIDEINRGNISKIFGELFMLIEPDKRGEKIQLIYSNEEFCVPPNVYIIGMMNTADRSLAMLDYALRRRFAFFEMKPAFTTEGFEAYMEIKSDYTFKKLINTVIELNKEIEDDDTLGAGFCIGHSYFCTDEKIDLKWMESVINYEIIPLLREYWFDDKERSTYWERRLKEVISYER